MPIEYEIEHPAEAVYALLTDKQFLAKRVEAVGEDPATVKVSKRGKKVSIELQRAARRDLGHESEAHGRDRRRARF